MFTRLANLILFFVTCIFLSACQMRWNEKVSHKEVQILKIKNLNCLEKTKATFKEFVDLTASDENLSFALDCVSQTLFTLQDKVEGSDSQQLSKEEFIYLIEKNVYTDNKLTSEFKNELFKFKVQLLGGSENVFTDTELKNLSQYLIKIKPLLININQTLNFFNSHSDLNFNEQKNNLIKAELNINELVSELASQISSNQKQIDFENILNLIVSIEDNFTSNENKKLLMISHQNRKFISSAWQFISHLSDQSSSAEATKLYISIKIKDCLSVLIKTVLKQDHLFVSNQDVKQISRFITQQGNYFLSLFWLANDAKAFFSLQNKNRVLSEVKLILQSFAYFFDLYDLNINQIQLVDIVKKAGVLSSDDFYGDKIINSVLNLTYHFSASKKVQDESLNSTLLNTSEVTFFWSSSNFKILSQIIDVSGSEIFELLNLLIVPVDSQLSYNHNHSQNYINLNSHITSLINQHLKFNFTMNDFINFSSSVAEESSFNLSSTVKNILKDKTIIFLIKKILVNNTTSNLDKNDLITILNLLAPSYYAYQNFDDHLYSQFSSLQYSKVFFTETLDLKKVIQKTLVTWLQSRNSSISRSDLLLLLTQLKLHVFAEYTISGESVQNVVDILLHNILVDPFNRLTTQISNDVIDLQVIDYVFKQVDFYLYQHQILANEYQKNLNSLNNSNSLNTINESENSKSTNIKVSQFLEQFYSLEKNNYEIVKNNLYNLPVYFDLKEILNKKYIYVFNDLNFLKLNSQLDDDLRAKDLVKLSISHFAARWLVQSFSQDLTSAQMAIGLKFEEAQWAFSQLRKLAVEIELIEPTNLTFMKSRFLESGLFTFHANGDDLASRAEISDILLHIYSGLNRNEYVQKQLGQSCLNAISHQKITFETRITLDCLTQGYVTLLNNNTNIKGMEDLPLWSQKFLNLPTEQQKFYILNSLKAAGHVDHGDDTAKFADIDLLPHVFQYIEILFKQFDTDQNGELTELEVFDDAHRDELAYPIFKPILVSVIKNFPNGIGSRFTEKEYPGVFIYFMKFRKPPEKTKEILKFVSFVSQPVQWKTNTPREHLAELFSFISSTTSGTVSTTTAVKQ